MGLVAYSDSEGSDAESTETAPQPKPTSKPSNQKPAFTKLVDRANPSKIKVNLAGASTKVEKDAEDGDRDGPPAKKARMGGGAFSGFNAMLPAPKRTGPIKKGTESVKRGLGRPLGVGVNLKTGAAPAFSRERAEPEPDLFNDPDPVEEIEPVSTTDFTSEGASTPATTEDKQPDVPSNEAQNVTKVTKPMMFRPLSVMQKKKRKTLPTSNAPSTQPTKMSQPPSSVVPNQPPAPKAKVSLFSMASESISTTPSQQPYKPIIHRAPSPPDENEPSHTFEPYPEEVTPALVANTTTLADIASSLPPSARRQLLGRSGMKDLSSLPASHVIQEFSTDQQYAENEALRAAGEQAQHAPVRAVAGGKHSLKQLVANASNQKDAYEEQFAEGRRNKKEAGSRYGW